jgi:hypothetical protein
MCLRIFFLRFFFGDYLRIFLLPLQRTVSTASQLSYARLALVKVSGGARSVFFFPSRLAERLVRSQSSPDDRRAGQLLGNGAEVRHEVPAQA